MCGSGSSYLYGYVDDQYRPDMTREELVAFIQKGVELAIFRDSSSGGCIRMVDITKDKVTKSYISYDDFKFKDQ